MNATYYRALVAQTRQFGSCYLHADHAPSHDEGDIQYRVRSYGRSLQAGGHKYKAYAERDGKPVPSKELGIKPRRR